MISDYRCYFCFTKAFEKLLDQERVPIAAKNTFVREMADLYAKSANHFSAPVYSERLHSILNSLTNITDPYKEVKQQSNDRVLGMYPACHTEVVLSANALDTALRIAIAGNIIDYAIDSRFDLQETIERVMNSEFAIDHSVEMFQDIEKANLVLYLGDNTGEIVFDKLLIETLAHPNLYYAVRGKPVINDATLEDAIYVGMDQVANVISNGSGAPSTIIEKCSDEFKILFEEADVVISKGQGNLEGLWDSSKAKLYSLLMVKCDVIAEALGVRKGDFVVKKNKQ